MILTTSGREWSGVLCETHCGIHTNGKGSTRKRSSTCTFVPSEKNTPESRRRTRDGGAQGSHPDVCTAGRNGFLQLYWKCSVEQGHEGSWRDRRVFSRGNALRLCEDLHKRQHLDGNSQPAALLCVLPDSVVVGGLELCASGVRDRLPVGCSPGIPAAG